MKVWNACYAKPNRIVNRVYLERIKENPMKGSGFEY